MLSAHAAPGRKGKSGQVPRAQFLLPKREQEGVKQPDGGKQEGGA